MSPSMPSGRRRKRHIRLYSGRSSNTDAYNAQDSEKYYAYWKTEERNATTGASVRINTANSGTTADNRLGYNTNGDNGTLGFYYVYNANNTNTDTVNAAGNGSTVLNVYYGLKPVSIIFHVGGYNSTDLYYFNISSIHRITKCRQRNCYARAKDAAEKNNLVHCTLFYSSKMILFADRRLNRA